MRSHWFFLVLVTFRQSADKDQQEMHAVAKKPHDAVVKFDTYRNVQRHRAVLPAIARHLEMSMSQGQPIIYIANALYSMTICGYVSTYM